MGRDTVDAHHFNDDIQNSDKGTLGKLGNLSYRDSDSGTPSNATKYANTISPFSSSASAAMSR
jgi:hypothetical protein